MSEKDAAYKRYVAYVSNKKAELQKWLDKQPNVSSVIVKALEMYKARQEGETSLDTEAIRQVMREELARVSITNGTSGPDRAEGDEDAEIKQGIGALTAIWNFDDGNER